MPTSVTLSYSSSNAEPFEVYLCLSGGSPCYYIDYINNADIPYTFTAPIPIQNQPGYCLKVIDSVNSEITNCFTIS